MPDTGGGTERERAGATRVSPSARGTCDAQRVTQPLPPVASSLGGPGLAPGHSGSNQPTNQPRVPARRSPRTPVLVSLGTLSRQPAPLGGPTLLCALAPLSLFLHTMATLVAPYVFSCTQPGGGCRYCSYFSSSLCAPICRPLPAPCGRSQTAPFSSKPIMSDRSTPSRDTPFPVPDTSRGPHHSSGAFPHVSDGYYPI